MALSGLKTNTEFLPSIRFNAREGVFSRVDRSLDAEGKWANELVNINEALATAANGPLAGILQVSHAPLVSGDLIGNPHSSIVDAQSTQTSGDRMAKVLSWYDNEWGFSNRMVQLAKRIG